MTVAVTFRDSPEGKAAVRAAAEEARLRSVPLAVLFVSEDDAVDEGSAQAVSGIVGEFLADLPPVEVQVLTATWGRNLAGAILDLAASVDATMLVVGSRQRSATGKYLLGSTVQRITLDATIPVLTVKADQA